MYDKNIYTNYLYKFIQIIYTKKKKTTAML